MSARPHPATTGARLDARSPFVVDTRELGRRAGSMRTLQRTVQAPDDWSLDLVQVPAGAPVELELRLEAVVDGVLVSGVVDAPVSAECGRCLTPVSDEIAVDIQELFAYEPDPADPEIPVLVGDLLDLEQVLHDAVVLALPFNPVCDEACEGLCTGCGVRVADLPADHTHDTTDPRWSALAALRPTDSDTPRHGSEK